LWKTGIKKNLKITEQQRIDLKLEVGGNDGIYGSAPMPVAFARGIVSAEINLGKLKVIPSLTIQKGFGGIAEEEKVILGISIPFWKILQKNSPLQNYALGNFYFLKIKNQA